MPEIKNTADLRKMLLDVIDDVRSGEIDAQRAGAISALSTRILQSAKLDLDAGKAATDGQEFQPVALVAENQPSLPPPQKRPPSSRSGFIGKREKQEKAVWYPDDWGVVNEMTDNGKSIEEIAEHFGCTIEEVEAFIAENHDEGEAEAPEGTGAANKK